MHSMRKPKNIEGVSQEGQKVRQPLRLLRQAGKTELPQKDQQPTLASDSATGPARLRRHRTTERRNNSELQPGLWGFSKRDRR